MTNDILYLDDVRFARMKRVQTVQHAVVAATMAFAGYSHLHEAGRADEVVAWLGARFAERELEFSYTPNRSGSQVSPSSSGGAM